MCDLTQIIITRGHSGVLIIVGDPTRCPIMLILEAGWGMWQGQWSGLKCPGRLSFTTKTFITVAALKTCPRQHFVQAAVPLSYAEESRGRMHAIRLLCTCVQSGEGFLREHCSLSLLTPNRQHTLVTSERFTLLISMGLLVQVFCYCSQKLEKKKKCKDL